MQPSLIPTSLKLASIVLWFLICTITSIPRTDSFYFKVVCTLKISITPSLITEVYIILATSVSVSAPNTCACVSSS